MLIADAAAEADIPPGVFNVDHRPRRRRRGAHDATRWSTWSPSPARPPPGGGSWPSAAPTVKKLQLELGGKSAQIVLGDVTRGLRPLHRLRHGARPLRPGLRAADPAPAARAPARRLQGGPRGDARRSSRSATRASDATVLGPLIREQQRDAGRGLRRSPASSRAPSSSAAASARTGFDKGFFYEPTVFVGTQRHADRPGGDLRAGPDRHPVLGRATTTRCASPTTRSTGSAGGVIGGSTRPGVQRRPPDPSRQRSRRRASAATPVAGRARATARARAGAPSHAGIGQTGAFGGYKQSGLGREWGRHGLEDFTEVKHLTWS